LKMSASQVMPRRGSLPFPSNLSGRRNAQATSPL
jgi:hypothetical protein